MKFYRKIDFTLIFLYSTLNLVNGTANGESGSHKNSTIPSKAYQIQLNTSNYQDLLNVINKIPQIISITDNIKTGEDVVVIVLPEDQNLFEKFLSDYNLNYTIAADNVERLIEEEAAENEWKRKLMHDNIIGLHSHYDVSRYHGYNEMVSYMNDLQRRFSKFVQVINIGTTYEGKPIKTIKISYPINDNTKRGIWIDAGIHAREWVAPSTAMYFINQLTENYYTNSLIKQYVNNFTWYITPCLNPDGYEYSRTSKKSTVRLWRKNRSRWDQYCHHGKCCLGIDLNRNFDFAWNSKNNPQKPCSEDFRGPSPFSEYETQAVRNFMAYHSRELDAFITLHSYAQYFMYPYGHKRHSYPSDVADLRAVAKKAAKAIKKKYGTKYIVKSSGDAFSYTAPGGAEDWAKAVHGIKYSYTIELRPRNNPFKGFIVKSKYIKPIGEETWEGMKVVADAVWKMNEKKKYAYRYGKWRFNF